jgi:hypothetical protein
MFTLWSTLKFQRYFSCYIRGHDIRRSAKGVTNATAVSKVVAAMM